MFFRNDDGLISIGLSEKANYSASAPLVASAWFVNGSDDDAGEQIAALVREAAG